MTRLVIALVLLLPLLAHAATLYKSVAPDGTIVYSDQPPQSGKIEKTFNFANLPATPLPESVLRYRKDLEKSMQNRLSGKQPLLFVTKTCGYCKQAEAYLAEKRIGYQKHDIETPDGIRAFGEAGGGRGVPVLVTTGQKVQGFSRQAYDALFASAR